MQPTGRRPGPKHRAGRAVTLFTVLTIVTSGCAAKDSYPDADKSLDDCVLAQVSDNLAEADADNLHQRLPGIHDTAFGSHDPTQLEDLYPFEKLDLDHDVAGQVYDASTDCGVDFRAVIADQAYDILGNHGDAAQACVNTAATDDNLKEYVVSIIEGGTSDVTRDNNSTLWRTFRTCEPSATSHTRAAKDKRDNGYFDDDGEDVIPSPATEPTDSTSAIQRCYELAAQDQADYLAWLNAGQITDLEYNQLMEESGADCVDLR